MKFLRFVFLLTVLGSLTSSAYVLDYAKGGSMRRWALTGVAAPTNVVNRTTHAIRYFLAGRGWSATNTTAELNSIRASFDQWQSISGTSLKFEEGGVLFGPINETSDGTNLIFWATNTLVNGGLDDITGSLGVTFSHFTPGANVMTEADLVLNGVEFSWFTDFNDKYNANFFTEGTLLHEIGHFIGLNHSPVGGATMLWEGGNGVGPQAGLSSDEIAAVRFLYPPASAGSFGALKGTVTASGVNVLGASVIVEDSTGNVVAGTVTRTNGTYDLQNLSAGSYKVRVCPLDDTSGNWLVAGEDIAGEFSTASTTFLPTTNILSTITAGVTNTLNVAVTNGTPAFRISGLRAPSLSAGSFTLYETPVSITVGQSNYTIGVYGSTLPGSGVTLSITGDGLTLGSTSASAFGSPFSGFQLLSVSISVASNATPGMRSFVVTRASDGAVAYANGFLDVVSAVPDFNFDGLDDRFQRQYFPVFTSASAAPTADPDGDGFNNTAEYLSGTDPTNALSLLKVNKVVQDGTGATITWQSGVGKRYQILSRANFSPAQWVTNTTVSGTGATTQYKDLTGTTGFRFYRVQAVP